MSQVCCNIYILVGVNVPGSGPPYTNERMHILSIRGALPNILLITTNGNYNIYRMANPTLRPWQKQ